MNIPSRKVIKIPRPKGDERKLTEPVLHLAGSGASWWARCLVHLSSSLSLDSSLFLPMWSEDKILSITRLASD